MSPLRFACILLLLASCGKREPDYPARLSQWNIDSRAITYELQTPLFSDYAEKHRQVVLPAGRKASFNEFAVFDLPAGTVIAKTFAYGGRRIETRILYHDPDQKTWIGLPYVWAADQSEATLDLVPDPVRLRHDGVDFEYNIPNANQCRNCHENAGVMKPIGLKARYLDAGAIDRLTGEAHPGGASHAGRQTLDSRARAYLDINCAHCHNPKGPANTSGLDLSYGQTDSVKLGVCKTPVAAGQGSGAFRFSIVPGRPEESILTYRMRSVAPKVQMPELGRSLVHAEGVALISEWIASLSGGCEATAALADRLP